MGTNNNTPDIRLEKIKDLLLRYLAGNYSQREELSGSGDDLDAIIAALNTLGEELLSSGRYLKDYEQRVSRILDVLLKFTILDFSEKAEISSAGDELDAIALGLNTLGEEIESKNAAEKKYAQELEKLAVILETTADAVTTISPDGLFQTWNKSAERIYGYAASEVVGKKKTGELVIPEERKAYLSVISKAAEGERVIDFPTRCKRKDGKIINVSVTISPITNRHGKVISISSISRDVTVQKEMERTLRDNEERFRLIVEGVQDYAIFSLDPEGYITSWNKGAEAIKGYRSEEILGKHISVFYTTDELKRNEPAINLERARKTGRFQAEGWRLRKDGSMFWADVLITALYNDAGKLTGFSKITRDITERKESEKKVRRLNQELAQNILMLRESNSELEAFTYSVSHDLRAPLRAIHGYTRVLSKDYVAELDDEAQSMMEAVMSNAKKMGQLIDDLLALSRLGRKDLQRRMLDMNAVVKSVVTEMRKNGIPEKTEIIVHDLPEAEADFSLITQVFTNLLSNAVKYSSRKDHPVVEIGATETETEHVFYIKDNGAGFDMKYYNKLFGVFQRLHDTGEFEGTGVGLAIVKRVILKHEGRVWAEGKTGEGATFYFSLKK